MMQKWEYKKLVLSPGDTRREQEELNRAGKEGWELVDVLDYEERAFGSDAFSRRVYYFKRPAVSISVNGWIIELEEENAPEAIAQPGTAGVG